MKWTLKDIIQETSHPFCNFYTLVYEVGEGDSKKEYSYYLISRRSRDELLAKTKKYSRPDGVTIPLYHVEEDGKVSLLISKQFRPALGTYLYAFPAGLMDPKDKDPFDTARREALEEAGVEIDDLELIAPSSTTSSGFSDETNAVVLGRITSFKRQNLEEFEDISVKLIPLEELDEMLKGDYFFAMTARLLILYLKERFS